MSDKFKGWMAFSIEIFPWDNASRISPKITSEAAAVQNDIKYNRKPNRFATREDNIQ